MERPAVRWPDGSGAWCGRGIQLPDTAKTAFLQGDQWAYLAGVIAVLLGATLVFFKFPKRDEEKQLLAAYQAQDTATAPGPAESGSALPRGAARGSAGST